MRLKEPKIRIDVKSEMPIVSSLWPYAPELIEWYIRKYDGNTKYKISAVRLQHLIFRLFNELVSYQSPFFLKGSEYLRPLSQTQLASLCRVHESTISRVVRECQLVYMGEELPVTFLFSGCVEYEKGPPASVLSLKIEVLRIIIDQPKASDALISQILGKKGFRLVRRTVGKYRKQMKVPSTDKRLADPRYISEAVDHVAPTSWLKNLLNFGPNHRSLL